MTETVKHKSAYDFTGKKEYVVCDVLASVNRYPSKNLTYNYNLVTCEKCLALKGVKYSKLKELAEIKINELKKIAPKK